MSSGERRKPGFYWVQFQKEVIVGELFKNPVLHGGTFWRLPGRVMYRLIDEVLVLSDRLTPPKKVAGKKK